MTKAANWYDLNHWNDGLGHTVIEPEAPARTGLLDANGNPLVRVPAPIGFDLTKRSGDERKGRSR